MPKSCNFKLSQLRNVSKDDFVMALLPDPTTAASERSSVKRTNWVQAIGGAGRFCGNLLSLPQCIEGCPQHESTQQRGAYGPLTLLPHKTRARHKKQAQVQNIQQNKFKRGRGRIQAHASSREKGVHNMKTRSQDL